MTMRAGVILALVALLGVVLGQQVNLFPVTADGFDTIFLDDMSNVNQISIQTATQDNLSFFVYGDGRMRTVNSGVAGFYVGVTPNENWHIPFIDLHTFRDINGVDLWGVGPLNAIYGRNRSDASSFQFEIGVVSTKVNPNNSRGRYFLEQPLGFEGLFYSSRIDGWDAQNVVGYFCGFFPPANTSLTNQLYFGVRRAHFNSSVFDGPGPYSDAWSSDPSIDDAVLYNHAQLVTFNSDFKPFIFHAWNINSYDPVNTTYLVVVDPYANTASLIKGNLDYTIPLNVTGFSFVPTYRDFGRIVSAAVYGDLLLVGVKAPGNFSGWIDVLHLSNLTQYTPPVRLPENFSNPQALVIDRFASTPTAYIGMNGGNAILRMDLITFQITGYQNLPHYLHSTWAGTATREHIYFVTNEQNSKVFRVNKNDICPSTCMQYGFCQAGKCVCGPDWELRSGQCQWKNYIIEKEKVKRNKGGEIALGVLFALTLLAAITGWFLVWRNRRGYQAV